MVCQVKEGRKEGRKEGNILFGKVYIHQIINVNCITMKILYKSGNKQYIIEADYQNNGRIICSDTTELYRVQKNSNNSQSGGI